MKKQNDIEQSKKIAEYLSAIMQNKEPRPNEEFEHWMRENSSATDILTELSDEEELTSKYENFGAKDKKLSAQKMLRKIVTKERKKILVRFSSTAAIVAVSFGIWYSTNSLYKTELPQEIAMTQVDDQVKLILESGEVMTLNHDVDSIKTEAISLRNTGAEAIAYIDNQVTSDDRVLINKLVVPGKKTYSIVLSDGTKVMLNANSELSFPNKFNGNTREVTIKGEGYFEVAKDSKIPFIVHTEGAFIKVYGTKFNINTYDIQQSETTLIEGSIGVTIDNKEQMLKPLQLIKIDNNNGKSKISDLKEIRKQIGWTNNYFIFQADNLQKVINELSRWYNVTFEIGNSKVDVLITGSFKRDTDLDEIIKSLEMISGIKLIKKSKNMTE